jgi:hypothetical protein
MTAADHILAIVKESVSDEEAARRIAEFIKPDYIPNGLRHRSGISKDDLANIQQARSGMRCGAVVGDDYPQSGPIYCGDPAAVFWWSKERPGCYCALCERHARRHGINIEATP